MIPAHVTEQAATGAKKCGRCSLHGCLDARRIEIVPGTGGRCDACLKIVCIKCDGCKCYKCEYATRRCEVCLALSLEKPALYLLMEPAAAFPNTNNRLLECNICKVLHSQRTRIASEVRKKKRRESCGYKLNDFGPRMTHRVKLHLRKWRATVVTRGWQPGDRRISRSLTSVRGAVDWPGDIENWRIIKESFFKSKEEKNRVYDKEFCEKCMNIPHAYL